MYYERFKYQGGFGDVISPSRSVAAAALLSLVILQEDGVEGRGHQPFMDLELVCQFIVLYDS